MWYSILVVIKNEKNWPDLVLPAYRSAVPQGERKEFELRLKLSDASRRGEGRDTIFSEMAVARSDGIFVRSSEMKSQN